MYFIYRSLGNSKLTSMSCGMQNIWGVDKQGLVYMRIGLKPPSEMALNPAWLPVSGATHFTGTRFVRIAVGPNDWMVSCSILLLQVTILLFQVWAIDNKCNVYARRGITELLPIGSHWVYVEGAHVVSLTVSEHHVYALTKKGEVLVRFGISQEHVLGDYWRAVPGAFERISGKFFSDVRNNLMTFILFQWPEIIDFGD
jgi:hypothetical protein